MRGCGRKKKKAKTCDSVLIPVTMNYSIVCGRIHAYQKGRSHAFYYSLTLGVDGIDSSYVSGLSLTHGLVGQRKHVWTFAGADDETRRDSTSCPCIDPAHTWPYEVPSYVGNSSVILVFILLRGLMIATRSSWTTLSGMVRAVVDLAPAALLIVLHGFVSI